MVIVRFSRDSGYPQKGIPFIREISSGENYVVDGEWAFAG